MVLAKNDRYVSSWLFLVGKKDEWRKSMYYSKPLRLLSIIQLWRKTALEPNGRTMHPGRVTNFITQPPRHDSALREMPKGIYQIKEKRNCPKRIFNFESEPLRNDQASGWSRVGDAERYARSLCNLKQTKLPNVESNRDERLIGDCQHSPLQSVGKRKKENGGWRNRHWKKKPQGWSCKSSLFDSSRRPRVMIGQRNAGIGSRARLWLPRWVATSTLMNKKRLSIYPKTFCTTGFRRQTAVRHSHIWWFLSSSLSVSLACFADSRTKRNDVNLPHTPPPILSSNKPLCLAQLLRLLIILGLTVTPFALRRSFIWQIQSEES